MNWSKSAFRFVLKLFSFFLSVILMSFYSPDGVYITTGSMDGAIFIWNAETAQLERSIKEHR